MNATVVFAIAVVLVAAGNLWQSAKIADLTTRVEELERRPSPAPATTPAVLASENDVETEWNVAQDHRIKTLVDEVFGHDKVTWHTNGDGRYWAEIDGVPQPPYPPKPGESRFNWSR